MRRLHLLFSIFCALQFFVTTLNAGEAEIRGELKFQADFEQGGLEAWQATDPAAWRIEQSEAGKVLALFAQSAYQPEVRSPFNINLVREVEIGGFVLELRLRSTTADYGHRDLCLFFGYQDSSHFYYVHLGKTADLHANSIFVVDGAPRLSIAAARTEGTDWDDNWHQVRLVRDTGSGAVEVYFDDFSRPVMTALDSRFKTGKVGLGSFDDTGQFDDIRLWTKK